MNSAFNATFQLQFIFEQFILSNTVFLVLYTKGNFKMSFSSLSFLLRRFIDFLKYVHVILD